MEAINIGCRMVKNSYLISGLGGALGVMLRVFLANIFPSSVMGLPTYILLVNLCGCFFLGLAIEVLSIYSYLGLAWRHFWITGFLGGLTTFSSYIFEFDLLLVRQHYILAVLYVFASLVLGFLMYILAINLVRWII
jgi:CrcB protein